jgi:hypothetical protein
LRGGHDGNWAKPQTVAVLARLGTAALPGAAHGVVLPLTERLFWA